MTLTLEKAAKTGGEALFALTPSQQKTFNVMLATIPGSYLTVLKGEVGAGKTLIIQHLQARLGGTIRSVNDIIDELIRRGGKFEETIVDFIVTTFQHDDLVFLDDFTMFEKPGRSTGGARPDFMFHVLSTVYDRIAAAGKRLVITTAEDYLSGYNANRATTVETEKFGHRDYLAILQNQLKTLPVDFDSDKLARTFKKLTAYQIVAGANLVKEKGIEQPVADDVIAAIDLIKPRSNLVVDDVEDVSLDGLVGVDHVVRDLMRTIVIPMTQPELARELGLKPARGILLHGEPGTGKTTIGRAIARLMKGKFFIMDGSVAPDGADGLLSAAEASSPSVFFIDDADVIFKNGENSGFARKLLTKLDGLESETIGNVCIIMTAMDVADMPPAIVRSGRVEVWLHMKLPDPAVRADVIRYYARSLPEEFQSFDETALIAATEGFTPADLRGLVSDARGHIAFDRHKGRNVQRFEEYLLHAAAEIHDRKDILAELAGKPRRRVRK